LQQLEASQRRVDDAILRVVEQRVEEERVVGELGYFSTNSVTRSLQLRRSGASAMR